MAHDIAGRPADRPEDQGAPRVRPGRCPKTSATTREELLAEANTPEALEGAEAFRQMMALCDTEEAAPSAGLRSLDGVHRRRPPTATPSTCRSSGPTADEVVACVYYIHGGGMTNLSCFDGMYRGWGKLVAANGVAVVMVDFRNAISPSSVPEVAPYPAGLNDCVSGFHWTVDHAAELGHRPGADRHRRRERRWQPHPGHRHAPAARRAASAR